MSLGKNIRSFGPASCQVPCELLSSLCCTFRVPFVCAAVKVLKTQSVTTNAHFFIVPPKSRSSGHTSGADLRGRKPRRSESKSYAFYEERNIVTRKMPTKIECDLAPTQAAF